MKVGAILTDSGRKYCGLPEQNPLELLLVTEGHRVPQTEIRSPGTNGFVERMNRRLLDECFRVQGRQNW